MKKPLLTPLLFLFCFFNKFNWCAVTKFPTFSANEESEASTVNDNRSGEGLSILKACQRRFRSYSDIDFDEHDSCKNKYRLEGVKYGSFYEFLRVKVIKKPDMKFMMTFEDSILTGQLSFPHVKLWLMMDKLVRESGTTDFGVLTYYVVLVVELTANSDDLAVQKLAMETLKHAIRSHKPLVILRALMKFLCTRISENDSFSIFKVIYASMDTEALTGNLSKDFEVLAAALESLKPLAWFNYIYGEGMNEHEFPPYVILSPFYFLLSKIDSENVIEPVRELLNTCVFDNNRENMQILSKFIKLTDFCTCADRKSETFKRRSNIFKEILTRFEVNPSDFEEHLVLAIERSSFGLVEAFLIYTEVLFDNSDYLCMSIMNALYASTIEMAVLLITYRPISSDEFIAMWRNTPGAAKKKLNSINVGTIIDLLKLSEEFDGDFSDVDEYLNNNGMIVHPFPEPMEYEHIANRISITVTQSVLCNYWIVRIILSRYFGVAFHSTLVGMDYDAIPIWREIAGAVNAFLLMRESKHRVNISDNQKYR